MEKFYHGLIEGEGWRISLRLPKLGEKETKSMTLGWKGVGTLGRDEGCREAGWGRKIMIGGKPMGAGGDSETV